MSLFNVWHPQQHSKTTVMAKSEQLAMDIWCQRWGYADTAHYCVCNQLAINNLRVEAVRH